MKKVQLTYLLLLVVCIAFSQEDLKEKEKALVISKNLTSDANNALSSNDFVGAEVDYRKAIAKSDKNIAAPYNLGNAYYNQATYGEAFGRFKQASESATHKTEKHKAFHNMANVFMKLKQYDKAVESYKEALRNVPKDEETRYNLALAKELLKKQQKEQQKNDKNDEKKDEKDKKDKENKKDNEKGDKDKNEDKKDKGEDKKEEKKEEKGDNDKKEEHKKQADKKENPEQNRQPRANQLSKQQMQNLLEAMQQKEKKVQEKIDAKKVRGVRIRNEKDW